MLAFWRVMQLPNQLKVEVLLRMYEYREWGFYGNEMYQNNSDFQILIKDETYH